MILIDLLFNCDTLFLGDFMKKHLSHLVGIAITLVCGYFAGAYLRESEIAGKVSTTKYFSGRVEVSKENYETKTIIKQSGSPDYEIYETKNNKYCVKKSGWGSNDLMIPVEYCEQVLAQVENSQMIESIQYPQASNQN